eukprot:PhF_6_TR29421/c0_g1_i4/m.43535
MIGVTSASMASTNGVGIVVVVIGCVLYSLCVPILVNLDCVGKVPQQLIASFGLMMFVYVWLQVQLGFPEVEYNDSSLNTRYDLYVLDSRVGSLRSIASWNLVLFFLKYTIMTVILRKDFVVLHFAYSSTAPASTFIPTPLCLVPPPLHISSSSIGDNS